MSQFEHGEEQASDQPERGGAAGMAGVRRAGNPAIPKPTLNASAGLGAWLGEIGGSLAFTTYQSARLFFVFAGENGETRAQERIVGSAMGLATVSDALWVSNKEQAWRFSNVGPRQFTDAEAVFMPRKGYFLGGCDTHDILADVTFKGDRHELVFVNTNYSCLAAIDDHYNFRPLWKPDFITALSPEDRCHLNGMGSRDGEVAFVTLCGRYDTPLGWRAGQSGGGMVVDVVHDQVLCEGLSMPHSPRWHRDRLWVLNSGNGDFGYVDNGRFIATGWLPGFPRGLCFVGEYAVIGLSKLRSTIFAQGMPLKARLEQAKVPEFCGLVVIEPETGRLIHWLGIEGAVTELYDVIHLPGIARPFTPGFSEPAMHREVRHVPENGFVYTLPRLRPEHKKPEASRGDVREA